MRLDKTRILIRERGLLEIMDLGLLVVRSRPVTMAAVLATTAIPLALFNAWIVRDSMVVDSLFDGIGAEYIWSVVFWTIIETPLATAPLTLYLGRMMFNESPSVRRITAATAGSLPQMLIYQLALRWLGLVSVVGIAYLAMMPYMSEVILLERNPLIGSKKRSTISTWRRSWTLHTWNLGIIIGRTLLAWALLGVLAVIVWGTLSLVESNLFIDLDEGTLLSEICLHAALWMVVGYAAVVRFLAYLDLRIRTEGWEVELLVRSATQHLEADRASWEPAA